MLTVSNLKKGDKVVCISDNSHHAKQGEIFTVLEAGWSRWDQIYYADIISDRKNCFELSSINAKHFELCK